jgi:hypothetical protein
MPDEYHPLSAVRYNQTTGIVEVVHVRTLGATEQGELPETQFIPCIDLIDGGYSSRTSLSRDDFHGLPHTHFFVGTGEPAWLIDTENKSQQFAKLARLRHLD